MAHEVFISYAHDEQAIADQVCAALETQYQLRCWIAPRDTMPGSDWVTGIGTAIARSRVLVLLLSAAADRSDYVKNEILWARDKHIPIVPLAIANAPTPGLGFLLNATQRLEAWTPPLANHLPRLAEAIQQWRTTTRSTALHIALLVRRQAEVDLQVAEALEKTLHDHDHEVFVDRQHTPGLAWAQAMEQHVRDADVVIPLLSADSVQNATHLTSIEALYHALGAMLADKLDLETFPSQAWNPAFPPNYNFERYMRREVLGQLHAPLVWGLDEVDRLFTCDFRSEVFGLFRSWHNARAGDPSGPWAQLTLVLSYATEAHLFIANLDQSPFNVGTILPPLADLSFAEVTELNQCYGSPLRHEADVAHLLRLLGGQPYLTSRWLYDMQGQQRDFSTLLEQAGRDDGPFGDHLKRLLLLLS
jgi:hypothetical protein